ncbi:MAG: GTP cyclohydrolase I FolE [Paracoccaceae bacterium]|nr:GTP cyclohydrolase I FolE [Paracoccaceae bacterium]MDE2915343.1 GTP cyclohydrolase I FolE [Paracoccaceae bacterium]
MNVFEFSLEPDERGLEPVTRPDVAKVLEAVTTLLRWAGDDPSREGLRETPERVARAYREWFSGYSEDPAAMLSRVFEEVNGYRGMIVLRDIRFHSVCEHHLAPIVGRATVGYLPDSRVVGISKLARVVDAFARRLQLQERLTQEIAMAIMDGLRPSGAAAMIEAEHFCMSSRGVHKPGVTMMTQSFRGAFETDRELRAEFVTAARRTGEG